uniref:F-box associated domain-containing protein n=1 Tax=Physcomitrium patens TaxID=3218 RepID=A0A2K1KI43_PHYPA|nr:hypothetical protein PHYPA_007125 [Physcomitrium patens]
MVHKSNETLVFDVGTNEWRAHWHCSFFRFCYEDPAVTIHFAIAQLVECNGVIYLVSKQEASGSVTHCIDKLELGSEGYAWTKRLCRHEKP